jgi:hypothetical protein
MAGEPLMAITINVNGLTLCHCGSGGVSDNTLPDVCKTPDNGVPVGSDREQGQPRDTDVELHSAEFTPS